MITIALGLCAVIGILAVTLRFFIRKRPTYSTLDNRHVVVTGGSSGIGLSAAKECAKLGAHVSIIGRDIEKLKKATDEIKKVVKNSGQSCNYVVMDVTSAYENIDQEFSKLEEEVGPIFMLVNCAGMCICGRFEEMSPKDIKYMMDLNYFGTALPTRYVISGMKQRKEGIIVFVSTEAALLGIYGYSSYGAAKWAVRGLAESLLMELIGTGVNLTISFPPDTDTPGFEQENKTKPEETKLISGTADLFSSEHVGKQLVKDALAGKTYSVAGSTGQLMTLLFCGSIDSVSQVLIQVFTMGFLRLVVVGFLLSFHQIVRSKLPQRKTETEKLK